MTSDPDLLYPGPWGLYPSATSLCSDRLATSPLATSPVASSPLTYRPLCPIIRQVSCSYTVLWNAFKRVAEGFSEADKNKLFYENARRVYSLDVYLKPRPIVEDDH